MQLRQEMLGLLREFWDDSPEAVLREGAGATEEELRDAARKAAAEMRVGWREDASDLRPDGGRRFSNMTRILETMRREAALPPAAAAAAASARAAADAEWDTLATLLLQNANGTGKIEAGGRARGSVAEALKVGASEEPQGRAVADASRDVASVDLEAGDAGLDQFLEMFGFPPDNLTDLIPKKEHGSWTV